MKISESDRQLVQNVTDDFEARKSARRKYELQWQLNIDYFNGRQNNYITNTDAIIAAGKQYYWQHRDVFNHISPMIESRLAKLTDSGENEQFAVVPLSGTESDKKSAQMSEKIIKAAFRKLDMKSLADQANMWSEMTGTGFYKVVWNSGGGKVVGTITTADRTLPAAIAAPLSLRGELSGDNALSFPLKEGEVVRKHQRVFIHEGDVEICVCSPFEIYPDNLNAGGIEQVTSIIHAKPYSTEKIKKIWGVDVAGGDVEIHDFNRNSAAGVSVLKNAAMVIERYKDGELVIVAGGKILQKDTYNVLPFVRQTSESSPGSFFGKSVIERAIPVQKAYNAVKNRKAEFLNRLACGVLAVEDGSVDIEALENDGLAPGTIIVYKQGSSVPKFVDGGAVPTELAREEEMLMTELSEITGGSDVSRGEFSNISGVALEIMVEQDNLRIRRAVVSGQNARIAVAVKLLKLYKKYASQPRLERLASGKLVELITFSGQDITSDDVTLQN